MTWLSLLTDEGAGPRARARARRGASIGERARALHENENGAIMLIGLFMACFLIGSLWTVIGIGDAIVFRDQMQEAADHSAFTSAALHAKGMNFISACNLVMMAFVFFHILLGIVNDVLFFACLIPYIDVVACPAYEVAHQAYTRYGNNVMKPALTGIHYAEMVAGYGYPWLGSVKGYMVGSDYGKDFSGRKRDLKVFVVSTSLVPGTVLDPIVNSVFKKDSMLRRGTGHTSLQKIGLPVAANPYRDICAHIATEALDSLFSFLDVPFLDRVKGLVEGLIGAGIQYRYCNSMGFTGGNSSDYLGSGHPDVNGQVGKVNNKIDELNKGIDKKNANLPDGAKPASNIAKIDVDTSSGGSGDDPGLDQWWGKDGPYYPWSGMSNGSAWNEVWSLNLSPEFSDAQEHDVAIAKHKFGATSTAKGAFAYFAEAEFYFDCDGTWDDKQCNGADNNAAYSVQWRARLRRTEFPQIMELLTSYGGDFLGNLNAVTGAFREVRNAIAVALPIKPLQALLVPLFRSWKVDFQAYVEKEAQSLGIKADSVTKGLGDGIYH